MSLVQLLQQITALRRDVENQIQLINDFKRSNGDNIALVRTELKGSTRGHDTAMLAALEQTENSLVKSLSALQQSVAALQRVETI